MEHSVQAYLERQTTEKLKRILQQLGPSEEYAADMIRSILNKRKNTPV